MRLEAAEEALTGYAEAQPDEDLEWSVSDLVTDLLLIVREEHGQVAVDTVLRRVDRDLLAEPETARDLYQLAEYHERKGHTSQAAKLYEQSERGTR